MILVVAILCCSLFYNVWLTHDSLLYLVYELYLLRSAPSLGSLDVYEPSYPPSQ